MEDEPSRKTSHKNNQNDQMPDKSWKITRLKNYFNTQMKLDET